MEAIYTLLQEESIPRTTKIQELAMTSQPYHLAQTLLRLHEDNESLRERVLQLETEKDAFKLLLSAHDKVEES